MFRKRPLFLCCTFYITASALAFCLSPVGKLIMAFLIAVTTIIVLIIALCGKLNKIKVIIFGSAAVFSAVAVMVSFLYFDVSVQNKQRYYGKVCDIRAVVTDRICENGTYSVYGIELNEIDGERQNFKALLECNGVNDLQHGFIMEALALGTGLENNRTGYDIKSLLSDGYKMTFSFDLIDENGEDGMRNKFTVTEERADSFSVNASRLNGYLCAKLRMEIGDTSGALAGALLLGNRSHIRSGILEDFKRAGVSHILALSGMHITVIMGFIDMILKRVRMRKTPRIVFMCVAAPLYLILTGCSSSATRAVIMVLIAYLTKLIGRRGDTLTSLSIAGALIMMVSPESVCDISYWLSFLATFGIVAGNETFGIYLQKLRDHVAKHRILKFPLYIFTAIIVSLFANSAVMCVMWLFFGELSLLSPISTLVLSPLAYLLIVFTLIYFAFSWIPYLSAGLAFLIDRTASLMISASGIFSAPGSAYISLRYRSAGVIIVAMTVLTVILLTVKLRKRYIVAVPSFLATVIVIAISFIGSANAEPKITYLNSVRSDLLVITSSEVSAVCDISNGKMNYYSAVETLKKNGKTSADSFIITHYHTGQANSIERFIEDMRVKNIYLPIPRNDEDYYEMKAIAEHFADLGIKFTVYDGGKEERLELSENVSLTVRIVNTSTDAGPVVSVTIDISDRSLEYIGRSQSVTELWDDTEKRIGNSDYLILGSHGPINEKMYSFTLEPGVNRMVLFTSPDTLKFCDLATANDRETLNSVTIVGSSQEYEFIMEK